MHRRNVNDVNEDTENMINESKNNKVSNRDGSSAPPKRLGSKKNKNISSSPATLASTQNGSGNSISFTTPLSNGHTVHSSGDTVTKLEYSIRLVLLITYSVGCLFNYSHFNIAY